MVIPGYRVDCVVFKRITVSIKQPMAKPLEAIFHTSTKLAAFSGIASEVLFLGILCFQKPILELFKLLCQLTIHPGPARGTEKRIWKNVIYM